METISPQDLYIVCNEDDEGIYVVDVRQPQEFAEGHIEGSVNIPMGDIADHIDDFKKHGAVYFVCRSGNRSQMICEAIASHDVNGVNLSGGLIAWQLQQLPLQK